MRLWTHYGDPEPDDLEALGMVEVNPNIEAAITSVVTTGGAGSRSGQLWPILVHPSDIQLAVAAALTPPGRETEQ